MKSHLDALLDHLVGHGPLFRDRQNAGATLAARLERYRGEGGLVLGLPRGGVVVAAEVARHLDAELDIVVARKLGSPHSAELAIGAVTADGGRFLNWDVIRELGISEPYTAAVTGVQQEEARRRETLFRAGRPAPDSGADRDPGGRRAGHGRDDACRRAVRPGARARPAGRGRPGGLARGVRGAPG